jgi:hypothetical protein
MVARSLAAEDEIADRSVCESRNACTTTESSPAGVDDDWLSPVTATIASARATDRTLSAIASAACYNTQRVQVLKLYLEITAAWNTCTNLYKETTPEHTKTNTCRFGKEMVHIPQTHFGKLNTYLHTFRTKRNHTVTVPWRQGYLPMLPAQCWRPKFSNGSQLRRVDLESSSTFDSSVHWCLRSLSNPQYFCCLCLKTQFKFK